MAEGPPKVTQPATRRQGLCLRFGDSPQGGPPGWWGSPWLMGVSGQLPQVLTGSPRAEPRLHPARLQPSGGSSGRCRRRRPACHEALAGRADSRPRTPPTERARPPRAPQTRRLRPRAPQTLGSRTLNAPPPRRPRTSLPPGPRPPESRKPEPRDPTPTDPIRPARGPHTRWPRRPRGAGPRRTPDPAAPGEPDTPGPERPAPQTRGAGPDPALGPRRAPRPAAAARPPPAPASAAGRPHTHLEGRVLLHLQGHGELGGRLLHRHLASAKTLAGGGEAPRGTPGSDAAGGGGGAGGRGGASAPIVSVHRPGGGRRRGRGARAERRPPRPITAGLSFVQPIGRKASWAGLSLN